MAGVFANAVFVLVRAYKINALPIGSRFESFIFVGLLIGIVCLYFQLRDRRFGSAVFLLPAALIVIGYAALFEDATLQQPAAGSTIIKSSHGLMLLTATWFVILALLASIMYLVKDWQIRHRLPAGTVRLPSLESLDQSHYVAVMLAWPFLTIGLGLGFLIGILALTDAKVIVSMLGWMIFTYLAHRRVQTGNRGKRIAYLTIAAASAVLFSFFGDQIVGSAHQQPVGSKPATADAKSNVIPSGERKVP